MIITSLIPTIRHSAPLTKHSEHEATDLTAALTSSLVCNDAMTSGGWHDNNLNHQMSNTKPLVQLCCHLGRLGPRLYSVPDCSLVTQVDVPHIPVHTALLTDSNVSQSLNTCTPDGRLSYVRQRRKYPLHWLHPTTLHKQESVRIALMKSISTLTIANS